MAEPQALFGHEPWFCGLPLPRNLAYSFSIKGEGRSPSRAGLPLYLLIDEMLQEVFNP